MLRISCKKLKNSISCNYEGFAFDQINILRGASYETLALLTTRPANNTTFTDINPDVNETLYAIEAVSNYTCSTNSGGRLEEEFAFTRSNVGDAQDAITSIVDVMLDEISVYPNPTSDEIRIVLDENLIRDARIRILNLQGKELYSIEKIERSPISIPLSGISDQLVLVELVVSGKVYTKRVVLE